MSDHNAENPDQARDAQDEQWLADLYREGSFEQPDAELDKQILAQAAQAPRQRRTLRRLPYFAAAASLLLTVALWQNVQVQEPSVELLPATNINPQSPSTTDRSTAVAIPEQTTPATARVVQPEHTAPGFGDADFADSLSNAAFKESPPANPQVVQAERFIQQLGSAPKPANQGSTASETSAEREHLRARAQTIEPRRQLDLNRQSGATTSDVQRPMIEPLTTNAFTQNRYAVRPTSCDGKPCLAIEHSSCRQPFTLPAQASDVQTTTAGVNFRLSEKADAPRQQARCSALGWQIQPIE